MAVLYTENTPADATFTPDTNAYADGDVVGGLLTFEFESNSGLIITVMVSDDDNEGAALDLFLFSQEPSTIADNAAYAPTFSDIQKLIRKISIASGDYATENSIKFAQKDLSKALPYPSRKLWGYLVTNGSTPTFAASKTVQVRLIPIGER